MTKKEPGKRAYIELESCSYRLLLSSSLPFHWFYLKSGLLLPAVENMAIENDSYYDNLLASSYPLDADYHYLPQSGSASQRPSSAESERHYVSVANRQKRE